MGYTHYFKIKKSKILGKTRQYESAYQKAIRDCQTIVRQYNKDLKATDPKHPDRLQGYSAHTEVGEYGGVNFNGVGKLAHETFTLREHLGQNNDFNFCKTAGKPYDIVVVACLVVLADSLGDAIEVTSDGTSGDWLAGLNLARHILKDNNLGIPDQIMIDSLEVV